jgi:hypothetical protein
MHDEGNAVLQWDNLRFARVDIAIYTYHEVFPVSVPFIHSFLLIVNISLYF